MKAVEKGALILAFWLGLSGIWFASSVWAQSAGLEEVEGLNYQVSQLRRQGKYAEAVPIAQKVLNIREKNLGADHPFVANSLNNLAGPYEDLGNYTAAEPLYKRSLEIREKARGPYHPDVAITLNNLAGLYMAMGNYAAAEVPMRRKGRAPAA